MTARSYDAVLCDIDGVLRHWPATDDLEASHGVPAGTLAAAAFAPSRLHPAITGEVTDEQWRSAVATDLAESCGSMDRALAERLGVAPEATVQTYYGCLLFYAGCTADAEITVELFEDGALATSFTPGDVRNPEGDGGGDHARAGRLPAVTLLIAGSLRG